MTQPAPRSLLTVLACLLLWAAVAAPGCAATSDGPTTITDPCVEGREITLDGQTLCSARLGVAHTGFQCPDGMVLYDGGGWAACSPSPEFTGPDVERAVVAGDGLGCGTMQLDVLVVVDPSITMLDEQAALAVGLADFSEEITGYAVDVRVAVTSMDHGCVVPDVASASGVFNQTAATVSGPWDRYQRVVACATDADCSAELGSAATWVCERPAEDACISNPNGSDNSRCRQLCDDDRDCEATVGLSGICQQFGISAASRGCVLPLPTEGCATATGPVLEGGELDQLACLAVMPHTQLSCFAHEQGMRAAWSALDPVGANAAQSAGFLREAAMLAVVFITDAEDCSLAPDAQELSADDALRCGQLADTAGGGPLWPTAALHDALVSLKADPAMVSVLTIAGDSLGADPTEVDSDRADYATSVADPLECHARSSICSTGTSVAQLGSRWLDLAARFGDRGLFHNVCTPAEIGASLRELVTRSGAGWLQTCGP